jgi:hypothetical protein
LPEIETNQVAGLIEELHSSNADSAALRLISYGASAIRPLRNFLLFGKPSNVFQPRYLAVEVLGRLQAREVLFEFLRSEKEIADPGVRLEEEAVKEKAARELASWKTDEVFDLLLDLIRSRPLAGFIEAIGEFNRSEAIPYLIDALGDDMCLPAAEKAVKNVYASARHFLIAAASTPLPNMADESPSSIRRRRSASRLLSDGGISREDWIVLAPLLDEDDPVILTAIAGIGVVAGSAEEKKKIANRLLDFIPGVDWSLQDDIENVLVRCFQECKARIDEEIAFHRSASKGKPVWDPVLQALVRIKHIAEEGKHE